MAGKVHHAIKTPPSETSLVCISPILASHFLFSHILQPSLFFNYYFSLISPSQPDNAASICDSPTCTRSFSYFHRRHHCRRCGNIFCDQHSLYAIPLDQDANYHPYGTRSRACEHCFLEYKGWEITRLSRSNSESSEDHPKTPNLSCGTNTRFGSVFAQKMGVGAENIGQSVPRDWNWSTF